MRQLKSVTSDTAGQKYDKKTETGTRQEDRNTARKKASKKAERRPARRHRETAENRRNTTVKLQDEERRLFSPGG